MAWMLEEIVKAAVVFLAGYLLNSVRSTFVASKCFVVGCTRVAGLHRGLCPLCYSKAKKKVDSGETTWEKLVQMNLCKVEVDPFDDAYSKAMGRE